MHDAAHTMMISDIATESQTITFKSELVSSPKKYQAAKVALKISQISRN